jgi:hypothetical protein
MAMAREQEDEQRRQWDAQQAQARLAWETEQRNKEPFLQARYAILRKYGINTDRGPAPSMPVEAYRPGGPRGAASRAPSGGGGGMDWGGALLGLGAAGAAAYAGYLNRPQPAGPQLPPMVMPETLPPLEGSYNNWNDWANYGLPGQGGNK